jgi:hypothetical protein
MKFEDIDPSEIKEGVLLDEAQTHYLSSCLKASSHLLEGLKDSVNQALAKNPNNKNFNLSKKFLEKLGSDLKYCVTILGEKNDL